MSFTLPVHIVYLDFICVSRDKNSSSNMKIDTLSFLNCILIHHQPTVFLPHIKTLVPVGKPHSDISNGLGFISTTVESFLFMEANVYGLFKFFWFVGT